MLLFLLTTFAWLVRPPIRWFQMIKQLHFIGFKSTFVVVLTALFTGMVLGLQGYYTLRKFGSEALLGSAVALSMIRELRSGARRPDGHGPGGFRHDGRDRHYAHHGTNRCSGYDGRESAAISRGAKARGGSDWSPVLVALFDVVGIWGGYLVGVDLLGVSAGSYWSSIESAVDWKDVYGGILKSISFGVIIAWVCCYKGYYTRMSAEGLGTATTEAVVLSAVLILVWDYFLTSVLL